MGNPPPARGATRSVVAFVAVIVVVGAIVGVVSLISGPMTENPSVTNTTSSSSSYLKTSSSATSASSPVSSTIGCPPINWANVTGAASISYQPAVQQIAQDPSFIALTHGQCYSFALTDYGKVLNTAQWEDLTNFVFDHFNGTIIYPCGVFPAKLIVSQIQVTTVLNGTTLEKTASMGLDNDTYGLNEYMACPYAPGDSPPVWVKSVTLVPRDSPAGPNNRDDAYECRGADTHRQPDYSAFIDRN